jgi:serine O-acetyltransferase
MGLQTAIAEINAQLRQLAQQVLIVATQADEQDAAAHADVIAQGLLEQLADIRQLLLSDVEAVALNDPAAGSSVEVICCYPAITAMLHHRIAHALHKLGLPLLPRIISERAHSITGIDIHPAAQIGASFGIDHGTGIVIGATTIIGHHVMLYQGVTLGARNFQHDADGRLLNEPRHPIIEDHVTIYSNTSVLGRIRIGHHSVIGGNLWITHDVPPQSQIRQSRPERHTLFIDGAGI